MGFQNHGNPWLKWDKHASFKEELLLLELEFEFELETRNPFAGWLAGWLQMFGRKQNNDQK